MGYRVKIIKKAEGFTLGDEKVLTLNEAKHLAKNGIAKILGKTTVDSLLVEFESLKNIVKEQGKQISKLEKLIPKK